jgi:hypothetical protein
MHVPLAEDETFFFFSLLSLCVGMYDDKGEEEQSVCKFEFDFSMDSYGPHALIFLRGASTGDT